MSRGTLKAAFSLGGLGEPFPGVVSALLNFCSPTQISPKTAPAAARGTHSVRGFSWGSPGPAWSRGKLCSVGSTAGVRGRGVSGGAMSIPRSFHRGVGGVL